MEEALNIENPHNDYKRCAMTIFFLTSLYINYLIEEGGKKTNTSTNAHSILVLKDLEL